MASIPSGWKGRGKGEVLFLLVIGGYSLSFFSYFIMGNVPIRSGGGREKTYSSKEGIGRYISTTPIKVCATTTTQRDPSIFFIISQKKERKI